MNNNKIYWIGGSPCCGKSTISEMLVKEYGFKYYKCDDYLDRFIEIGVKEKDPLMTSISQMSQDEIWLRNVDEQVLEEFEFYRYALKTIKKDIEERFVDDYVIVEGAALLPEFMKENNILKNRYICMTPSREFQIEKYKEREWVQHYLSSCTDWEKAFENWMLRDIDYAKIVRKKAIELDYSVLEIDGGLSIEDVYKQIKEHFVLGTDFKQIIS